MSPEQQREQENFVDFDTAKRLNALLFDMVTPSIARAYDKNGVEVNWTTKHFACWKPIWQQVKRWLWERHKISIEVERVNNQGQNDMFKCRIYCWSAKGEAGLIAYIHFDSPIEAEIEGIKKAVEHLHENRITK